MMFQTPLTQVSSFIIINNRKLASYFHCMHCFYIFNHILMFLCFTIICDLNRPLSCIQFQIQIDRRSYYVNTFLHIMVSGSQQRQINMH